MPAATTPADSLLTTDLTGTDAVTRLLATTACAKTLGALAAAAARTDAGLARHVVTVFHPSWPGYTRVVRDLLEIWRTARARGERPPVVPMVPSGESEPAVVVMTNRADAVAEMRWFASEQASREAAKPPPADHLTVVVYLADRCHVRQVHAPEAVASGRRAAAGKLVV